MGWWRIEGRRVNQSDKNTSSDNIHHEPGSVTPPTTAQTPECERQTTNRSEIQSSHDAPAPPCRPRAPKKPMIQQDADVDVRKSTPSPLWRPRSPSSWTEPMSLRHVANGPGPTDSLAYLCSVEIQASGGDSGKTVVYTDRGLSRPLLEHFGAQRDPMDMTRFTTLLVSGSPLLLPGTGTFPHPQTSDQWRITHTVPTSVSIRREANTDTWDVSGLPAANTKTATSYTGSLYGNSGSFVCGGADGCRVQVVPTYNAPALPAGQTTDTRLTAPAPLTSVAVSVTAGTLFFKPSGSPTLQLYEDGPVGSDDEYMVFGYWREDPTSAAADYQVGVFAQAFTDNVDAATDGDGTSRPIPDNFTATYDGTAVGMYVEQDPNNAVDTHRQGEFVADVFLQVNGADESIQGTIDDFVTTPTGGSAEPRTSSRWVVRLLNAPDNGNNSSTAVIENLTGVKHGSWGYAYVPAHEHAAFDTPTATPTGTIPPAVTGTFNTRIEDFVHLLGAFGAEKR